MTDVLKTVVDLEGGRTPTKQPADNCDHIQQYNNTDIAIPPLRVTYARVLAIANSTENALTLVSDEMKQLRDAVIQNRLVLDILTAERGGVCKMLGVSCFNIPDYSDNITNIIEHMREAVREPERTNNLWAG
uniref:Uncharacterized protein n=1 Tax=Cyprinus carpio TaxID=7962 RepID=A0A8C2A062_CYPCA